MNELIDGWRKEGRDVGREADRTRRGREEGGGR